jgi:hypothetical protein
MGGHNDGEHMANILMATTTVVMAAVIVALVMMIFVESKS